MHDVNLELTKIKAWLNQNKLTLNVQKTSYMIFSGKNNNYSFNIKFGGEELHQCSEFKYLGVILDDRMSWMPHIRKLEKKISSSVWALSRLRSLVPETTMRRIYYGLLHPHFKYCISCWGGATTNKLKKLISLQKRAIKTICLAKRRDSPSPLFQRLSVLKLKDLYQFQIAIIMHKTNHDEWAGDFSPVATSSTHSHNTRFASKSTFKLPIANNEVFKKSLNFVGPHIWNSLPEEFKSLNTIIFKSLYKKHLVKSYNR